MRLNPIIDDHFNMPAFQQSEKKRINFTRPILAWLIAFVATAAAIAITYFWVDRPLAFWVHDHVRRSYHVALNNAGRYPDPLIPIAAIIFVCLGLRALAGRLLTHAQTAAFSGSVSIIFAEVIKDQLKLIFGRTWPEPGIQDNPSLISSGTYGFHFMQGGSAYQSFPSGHMAAACAVITVLWIWYPRLRWLCIVAATTCGAGLIVLNYHFLSDVIGGAFVGVSTGLMASAISKGSAPIFLRRT